MLTKYRKIRLAIFVEISYDGRTEWYLAIAWSNVMDALKLKQIRLPFNRRQLPRTGYTWQGEKSPSATDPHQPLEVTHPRCVCTPTMNVLGQGIRKLKRDTPYTLFALVTLTLIDLMTLDVWNWPERFWRGASAYQKWTYKFSKVNFLIRALPTDRQYTDRCDRMHPHTPLGSGRW